MWLLVLEAELSSCMALAFGTCSASGEGLLAASQHGGGDHTVRQGKRANSGLSSLSYKAANVALDLATLLKVVTLSAPLNTTGRNERREGRREGKKEGRKEGKGGPAFI
jgi:hypothetical protein